MVQNLQMAWVVVATCEVHYEAVKSQKKDGWGGGGLYIRDNYGRCEAESDREAGSRRHLGLS